MRECALSSLPAEWRARFAQKQIIPITSGMSGADVFRIIDHSSGDQYLKISEQDAADHLRSEIERTAWLQRAGVPVPTILKVFDGRSVVAVIMTGLNGQPLDQLDVENRRSVFQSFGRAMARLHSLPIEDCPFDESVGVRLARARSEIERGGIDPSHFDARNSGLSAEKLYDRLSAAIPAREDLVVVHGDATLSNLILQSDGTIGFIDCGNAGRADRYVDLAPLVAELTERFGPQSKDIFLRAYGLTRWDESKALFYSDLYELF
jgi:aminoglycoside 3'-phosphotransferase II